MNVSEYSYETHKHVLAVWAAGTAANNSTSFRFSVEFAKKLLLLSVEGGSEKDFIHYIGKVTKVTNQKAFDEWHKQTILSMLNKNRLCTLIAEENQRTGKNLNIDNYTYGIAAKLLNVYLKVYFLGDFSNKQYASYIHPPIDRLLLEQLKKVDKDLFFFDKGDFPAHKLTNGLPAWTQLTAEQYSDLIERIKKHLAGYGILELWKIEYAWKGHQ